MAKFDIILYTNNQFTNVKGLLNEKKIVGYTMNGEITGEVLWTEKSKFLFWNRVIEKSMLFVATTSINTRVKNIEVEDIVFANRSRLIRQLSKIDESVYSVSAHIERQLSKRVSILDRAEQLGRDTVKSEDEQEEIMIANKVLLDELLKLSYVKKEVRMSEIFDDGYKSVENKVNDQNDLSTLIRIRPTIKIAVYERMIKDQMIKDQSLIQEFKDSYVFKNKIFSETDMSNIITLKQEKLYEDVQSMEMLIMELLEVRLSK
jgi:hypothetical protein